MEKTMSRRGALGALVATAVVLPFAQQPSRATGPTLADLIAEQKRLYDGLIPLLDAEVEAEERYRKTLSPLVPLTLTPTGRKVSGSLELRMFGREHVAGEIRKTHASLLERHCSPFREDMAPAATAEMRAALKKSQARCMRALNAAVREMDEQKEASGYAKAQGLSREASAAEIAGSRAIFAHIPRTTAEAEAKVEWIKSALEERGQDAPDPEELEALFGALAKSVLA